MFCRIRYLFSRDAVEISVAAHDTTGGMETKILEAAVIARLGIDVYITKVRMLCFHFSILKHGNGQILAFFFFWMDMTQALFNVLCDAGWNRTLAEGLKGRCEHWLGRLAWNYYTLFQIDFLLQNIRTGYWRLSVILYEPWWALGFWWWFSTGLFPTVIVVWFISVSLMLQVLFSNFVLFFEKAS